MKIKRLITGMTLAGLCLALTSVLLAQDAGSSQQTSSQSTQPSSTQPSTSTQQQPSGEWQQGGMGGMGGMHAMTPQTPTDVNKGSKIIGMNVRNGQDQKLGSISDLIIDWPSQRVAYAVLEKSNEQGNTGKYIAIPINLFRPTSDMKNLVLNVDKNKVDNARGFAKNQLPTYPLPRSEIAYWHSISEPAGAQPSSQQQQPSSEQQQQPSNP
jgi:sporulation protein YlmC with PRC-barrel domain